MNTPLDLETLHLDPTPGPPSPEAARKLAFLSESDQEFFLHHPFSRFEQDLKRKYRAKKPTFLLASSVPFLAAAVLLFILWLPNSPESSPGIQIKSSPVHLILYHNTGSGSEIVRDSQKLKAGDGVQISYYSQSKGYAMIISVDGRGVVTTHLPLGSTQAIPLDSPEYTLLPYSYKLDDAPDFEIFYLVASSDPFSLDLIDGRLKDHAASQSGELVLPENFSSTFFTLNKQESSE